MLEPLGLAWPLARPGERPQRAGVAQLAPSGDQWPDRLEQRVTPLAPAGLRRPALAGWRGAARRAVGRDPLRLRLVDGARRGKPGGQPLAVAGLALAALLLPRLARAHQRVEGVGHRAEVVGADLTGDT